VLAFSELSVSLAGLTADTNYDLWVYNNGGTAAMDTPTAWTNATTRATAITLQNGVYVKSGATTRRYVGTIRITGTIGQTEDSLTKRFVWNAQNRVPRAMRRAESTDSWTWSTSSWQQANAGAGTVNQLAYVRGIDLDPVSVVVHGNALNSGSTPRQVRVTIGLDGTSGATTGATIGHLSCTDSSPVTPSAFWIGVPGLGYHYNTWLEYGGGTDTQTWRGDNGGVRSFNRL
jgi:hypothetical protein